MKKMMRTLLLMILIVSLVSAPAAMAAQQAPRSNAYVSSFDNEITAIGDGKVKIGFDTWGMGTMDKIGASVIKLYDQDGLVYTFRMSNATYASQMVTSNSPFFHGSVTYQGVEGNTYYATVTHYAAKGTGSGAENYTTNSVVA